MNADIVSRRSKAEKKTKTIFTQSLKAGEDELTMPNSFCFFFR